MRSWSRKPTLVILGKSLLICSGLLGDIPHQVDTNTFTWKMGFKRPFISDSGEDCALHIHCSGLQETELMQSI